MKSRAHSVRDYSHTHDEKTSEKNICTCCRCYRDVFCILYFDLYFLQVLPSCILHCVFCFIRFAGVTRLCFVFLYVLSAVVTRLYFAFRIFTYTCCRCYPAVFCILYFVFLIVLFAVVAWLYFVFCVLY